MSKKKNPTKMTDKNKQGIPKQAPSSDKSFKLKAPQFLEKNTFWKKNIFHVLIISVLSFVIYAQSIGHDYVLDDTMVIVKNEFTKKGIDGIGDIFRYESFRGYFGEQKQLLEGDRYRPLSIATFAIEQSLFGGNKAISHFINILLYALSGILLYRVLWFMFPLKNKEEIGSNTVTPQRNEAIGIIDEGNSDTAKMGLIGSFFNLPFIATLLFIVHPLHVEVVANIKGRDEILALMGELGALYFTFLFLYLNKKIYLIYSFLSICVGIFSKESVITFLAIVPLTVCFFTKATWGNIMKVTLPVVLGVLLYLAMRVNAIGYLMGGKEIVDLMNNPFYGMTFSNKMATIFYTLLIYLKLHIFPHPLTHDYYPFHIPRMTWGNWESWVSLLLHLGLGLVILRGWRTRSVWAYAAAFYLVTLSIVSNIFVSVGTFMNERFVYHASLGFCIALSYFLTKKIPHNTFFSKNTVDGGNPEEGGKGPSKVAFGIASVLILGFAIRTIVRVPDWRNGTTLNDSAILHSPNSARANCFYAVSLWENRFTKLPENVSEKDKRACLDSMQLYFNRSVEILPKYGAAQKMRAAVAAEYHKLDKQTEPLLKVFREVNLSGTYEKFVLEYLKFINGTQTSPSDIQKSISFFDEMIIFYKKNYPNSRLDSEYANLKTQLLALSLNNR
jgi:protein O-mannosyl-transferase